MPPPSTTIRLKRKRQDKDILGDQKRRVFSHPVRKKAIRKKVVVIQRVLEPRKPVFHQTDLLSIDGIDVIPALYGKRPTLTLEELTTSDLTRVVADLWDP
eukprot:TRINITY_DN1754_c0_g1_i1.p1 TRINITY_DN1754_c0_g1~~TRINITY_DN1754_c0_g1_i1.p1  ORF type:complete len:100 (+),score=19.86 TRINITY_DN1754_c0_g1_i1:960-1259(+)